MSALERTGVHDTEVAHVRAIVSRTIDEEGIAYWKGELEEASPHPMTEEEAESFAREGVVQQYEYLKEHRAEIVEQFGKGEPHVVEGFLREALDEQEFTRSFEEFMERYEKGEVRTTKEFQIDVIDEQQADFVPSFERFKAQFIERFGKAEPHTVGGFLAESFEELKAGWLEQSARGEPDQVEECKLADPQVGSLEDV